MVRFEYPFDSELASLWRLRFAFKPFRFRYFWNWIQPNRTKLNRPSSLTRFFRNLQLFPILPVHRTFNQHSYQYVCKITTYVEGNFLTTWFHASGGSTNCRTRAILDISYKIASSWKPTVKGYASCCRPTSTVRFASRSLERFASFVVWLSKKPPMEPRTVALTVG